MIASARRRHIKVVSNSLPDAYNSWNDAFQAAYLDTVRPVHIRTDGHDLSAYASIPGGHCILESITSGFATLSQLDLQGESDLTLLKMNISELTANSVQLSEVSIRSGFSIYNDSNIDLINFQNGGVNQPPRVDSLVLSRIQASVIRMNGSKAGTGSSGSAGVDAPGANGAGGLNEDMYSSPTNGGVGQAGGAAGNGGNGGNGSSGTATGGVINAYNCTLGYIYIHGSNGGDGGNGGSGGLAPGGDGGPGGNAYTPGMPPGNGGDGGVGGVGGDGGNGGNGGNGSLNTNPVASQFVACSITSVIDTPIGGAGGNGGSGGEAPGGNGGAPGYNISDATIGSEGSPGNNGTGGDVGSAGSAGSNGAAQTWGTP